MKRDGDDCWFCLKPLGDDVTIEHLHPQMMGGSWHEDNLALAHAACNKAAGHLPRAQKETLRAEAMRKFNGEQS
jgi:5-methylcytosine-specific restriction endonuclease McrA